MKIFGRITIAVLSCLLILLSACSPSPTDDFQEPELVPGDTFTPVLASTSNREKLVIMFPKYTNQGSYEDVLARLNGSLSKKGWNIEFVLENDTYASSGSTGSYLEKVRSELTSGETTADAYVVYRWNLEQLADVPTMDLTSLLPQTSPVYYSKCMALQPFPDSKITGLPMGINSVSCRIQPAFMLRRDYEDKIKMDIKTIGDVFRFIDNYIIAEKKVCSVLADPYRLINLWVFEQGYYLLGSSYSAGRICARIDDDECKPVLLEKIPGFYEFVDKMANLYKKGYLIYPDRPTNGWDNIGMVRDIGEYYEPDAWNMYSWVGGEFIAHELYAELPSYYAEASSYNSQLLIPENSGNAVNMISFVEWLYAMPENYTSVVYGEEGVDIRVSNGRYNMLRDGEPAVFKTRNEMNGIFMTWPGVGSLSCSDYNLLPANAPSNIEKIIDKGEGTRKNFAFNVLMSKATKESQKLMEPSSEMRTIMDDRDRLISEIANSFFYGDYTLRMKPLENLKNDWLLDEYAARIVRLRGSIGNN